VQHPLGPVLREQPLRNWHQQDITYLRLAETKDGIHFTDLGRLQGLNDPADVTASGTRWLATAGTILKLEGGRWGLLYSGGGCIDGDSDAFRYIGYAESEDLLKWHVVNGPNNPILSTLPYTIAVDQNGLPVFGGGGTPVTFPAKTPSGAPRTASSPVASTLRAPPSPVITT
jgi:hypothetical protein